MGMENVDSKNPLLRLDGAYISTRTKSNLIMLIFYPVDRVAFWRFKNSQYVKETIAEWFFERGFDWQSDGWGWYWIKDDGALGLNIIRTEDEFGIFEMDFEGIVKKNGIDLTKTRIHNEYGPNEYTRGIQKNEPFKFIPAIVKGKTLTGRTIGKKEKESLEALFSLEW